MSAEAIEKITTPVPTDYQQWQRDGVLVLREFFSRDMVDAINSLIDRLWQDRSVAHPATTIDAWLEQPRHQRLLFSTAPAAVREQPYKLNDLYLDHPLLREVILDRRLCTILDGLLQGEPLVCNSLNFEFGSEQKAHLDTLYMTPRREDKLVVSWIALDEVGEDNGPVLYYPGSHLIPPYRFSDGGFHALPGEVDGFHDYINGEIGKREIRPQTFHARPGDVLIWHARLLHGGSRIRDYSLRRRSLVTHYFRRADYRHHFWRIRKQHDRGFYLKRRHPRAARKEVP